MNEIPLAWLQLTKNKVRMLGTLIGIAILVAMLLTNFGFRDALYESNTKIHENLKGDVLLIHKKTTVLHESIPFSRRYLYQLAGSKDIKSISSLYLEFARLKILSITSEPFILVFGVNIINSPFNVDNLNQKLDKTKISNVVLIDKNCRPEYKILIKEYESGKIPIIKLNQKKVKIEDVAEFTTASFVSDVTLVTSIANFIHIFPHKNFEDINIGVIELQKNINPETFIENLARDLPTEIKLLTRQQFIDSEKQYWSRRTPIGFVFSVFTLVALFVEAIVVYQIMSTEISSHIPEYAVLKARGYSNSYFVMVVLQESILLAILGYIPGFAISLVIYNLGRESTGLPINMNLPRAIIALLLTIGLCFFSSLLATRKLQKADPINLL